MSQFRKLGNLTAVAVLALFLASCGLGGDDDEDPTPTPTSEQASLDAVPTPTAVPSTPEAPFALVTPTDDVEDSTPDPSGPSATIVADQGTPAPGTPESTPEAASESASDQEGTPPAVAAGPDDGATPASGVPEDAGPSTAPPIAGTGSDGTSGAALREDAATPVDDAPATPETTVNAIEFDSCDVVEAPPFAGATSEFQTSEDVNFRVGPGSDCESVLDGPLGPNVAVEVVGGPVVRTDVADGILWLQVIVGDDTGWIAQDFLEEVTPD